jgi:AcrR family transcriptional regulator
VKRDQAILEAALALFHERGYAAVGVDEIGARAGVSGPAIYRHFTGKDEVLGTLVDQAMDRLLSLTEGAGTDLERLVAAHVRFAVTHRALLAVYTQEMRSLREADRRRTRRRQRQYVERWVDALGRREPAAPRAERLAAAHAAIGLIQSSIHWPRELLSAPGLEDRIARLELAALTPQPADAAAR